MEKFKITTETGSFPENFVKVTGGTIKGNDYPLSVDYGEGVFPVGRTVTLSDFYIGKYEITQAEYKGVMARQKVTANGYRLPGEAEWEYAARCGEPKAEDWNYKFSGADTNGKVDYSSSNSDLDSVGWYDSNNLTGMTYSKNVTYEPNGIGCGTHEVGKKAPNRLGLYDMSGNVFEWCYDRKEKISCTENVINPVGSASEDVKARIYRGGCWRLAAERTKKNFSEKKRGFSGRTVKQKNIDFFCRAFPS